jgi:hypothetical protein
VTPREEALGILAAFAILIFGVLGFVLFPKVTEVFWVIVGLLVALVGTLVLVYLLLSAIWAAITGRWP